MCDERKWVIAATSELVKNGLSRLNSPERYESFKSRRRCLFLTVRHTENDTAYRLARDRLDVPLLQLFSHVSKDSLHLIERCGEISELHSDCLFATSVKFTKENDV